MSDITNAGIPAAGGQLSGEASKAAAIRRLQKQRSAPNTGPTGLPKPERSLVQLPGSQAQSSTPKRI